VNVVAFNGSPNKDGNTAILIRHVLGELESEGIATELVHIGDEGLVGCNDCGICVARKDDRCAIEGDPVNDWIAKIVAAEGVIIGSPVYFANCTAATQALIERCGYPLRKGSNPLPRKVGAAVVAARRAGAIHAFDSINHFFQLAEMVVVGSSYWNIGMGREPGAVERDAEGIETMRVLGRNMAGALTRLHG
jgi:multimeric flavodoxin WrbA